MAPYGTEHRIRDTGETMEQMRDSYSSDSVHRYVFVAQRFGAGTVRRDRDPCHSTPSNPKGTECRPLETRTYASTSERHHSRRTS